MKNKFNSIRVKITLLLSGSFILLFALLIGIGYYQGFSLLKDTIGYENIDKVSFMASAISRIINEEMGDAQFYLKEYEVQQGIEQHYNTIKGISPGLLKKKYLSLDSQWADTPQDDPLISPYLTSPLSLKLKQIVDLDSGIDEILIADKFGGLIGASGKTSDYYQADEEWWRGGYDLGKGLKFFDNMEFDDSVNQLVFPVVLPLKKANGETIAVCKILLNANRIFSPLHQTEPGGQGHFALLDGTGNIMFHHGINPHNTNIHHGIKHHNTNIQSADIIRQLNLHDKAWFIGASPVHHRKSFYAFSKVKSPHIQNSDLQWFAVYDTSIQDVFQPLKDLMVQALFVSIAAVVLIMTFGMWLGKKISSPILALGSAARKLGEGDLEHRIKVLGRNDEIDMVADALNTMAENLQKNMTSVENLNQEISRRKEAENILKENESNLTNVIQNNIYGIVVVDADGNGLFANAAAEEILGKSGDQLIGRNIGLPLVVGEKTEVQISYDAGQKVCEMRCTQMQWKRSQAVMIILRDITEEKAAEKKVRESAERYRSFIRVTAQVAWITDPHGQVNQDLPEWRKFTGQSAEEILGLGWAKALHPDDVTSALQAWRKAVEEKCSYETEYRLRRHDGMYRSMLARGVPLMDDDGMIQEWIGVCIDITERKRLEDHLRVQEQLLRNIINTIPAYVFWKDRDLVYLGCNENFAKATGLKDPKEIEGKSDYDLAWKKEEADHYREDDREVMDTDQPKFNIEETQLQEDGAQRHILTNKVPLRDEQGAVCGILGTFMDITKLKTLEGRMIENQAQLELTVRELEQSNQKLKEAQAQFLQAEKMAAVGQLSAGVAHEVKNPLAIISLAINSLKRQIPSMDEKTQRYFRMITEATERANKVIGDLMNFSRYSEIESADVKILEALDATIRLCENSAHIKGIEIVKDFQCPPGTLISGDVQLMEQVFLNLLGNALDAIRDEKGTVTVRASLSEGEESPDQQVVIEISDTGRGIAKEHMEKVFNPFFTTKEQGQGTGLGLSTVFMIIENHKGTIEVNSREGEGTTFTIVLPLQNCQG